MRRYEKIKGRHRKNTKTTGRIQEETGGDERDGKLRHGPPFGLEEKILIKHLKIGNGTFS